MSARLMGWLCDGFRCTVLLPANNKKEGRSKKLCDMARLVLEVDTQGSCYKID